MAERDYTVNIKVESQAAQQSFGSFIINANQGLELLKKSFEAANAVTQKLFETIDRGDKVLKVKSAFDQLNATIGNTASIDKFRTAVNGALSDMELRAQFVKANGLGITPADFEKIASAADKLSDSVGGELQPTLESLISALGSGRTATLRQFQVVVDTDKAFRDYAVSVGKSAEKLSEAEKRTALMSASIEALEKRTNRLGSTSDTAQDSTERLSTAMKNAADNVATAITKSEALTGVLGALAITINGTQWGNWAERAVAAIDIVIRKWTQQSMMQHQFNQSVMKGFPGIGPLIGAGDALQSAGQGLSQLFNMLPEDPIFGISDIASMFSGVASDINSAIEAQVIANNGPMQQWGAGLGGSIAKGVADEYEKLPRTPQIAEANAQFAIAATEPYQQELHDTAIDHAQDMRAQLEFAFQDATDFWTDIFADALNGEFELDNLEESLKRAAAGFGGSLMASIVGGPGGTISAQGFGQMLAQQLFGTGASAAFGGSGAGGNSWTSSLWGAGGAGAVSELGGISTSTSGAWGAGAGTGFELGAGGMTGLAAFIPAIIAMTGVVAYQNYSQMYEDWDSMNGDSKALGAATTAIDMWAFGLGSLINQGIGMTGLFGPGKGAQEEAKRFGILEWLGDETNLGEDESFAGVNGQIQLDPTAFNVDQNSLAGQAVGVTQGIADLFAGGDDKIGDDLAGIFANAVAEGENFNEVMINTLSLMGDLGVTTEEAKNQLSSLFLDGTLSIDEFGADIAGLNLLATENLIGENSILDALNIIFNNIDDNRKVALKGFELLFTELKERGITSMSEVADYLSGEFGVNVTSTLETIAAAGITEFTNLSQLSADQLFALFNALSEIAPQMQEALGGSIESAASTAGAALEGLEGKVHSFGSTFANVFESAGESAADSISSRLGRIYGDLEDLQDAAEETADAIAEVGGGGRGNGGGSGSIGSPGGPTRRTIYPSVNRLNRAEL